MKLILSALILISSTIAFAGISTEDSSVAELRTRFKKASVNLPKKALKADAWECTSFFARKGHTKINVHEIDVIQRGGVYSLTNWAVGNYPAPYSVQTPQGLMLVDSSDPDFTLYVTYRADRKGIIGEYAFKIHNRSKYEMSILNTEPSQAVGGALVGTYSRCTPKNYPYGRTGPTDLPE